MNGSFPVCFADPEDVDTRRRMHKDVNLYSHLNL